MHATGEAAVGVLGASRRNPLVLADLDGVESVSLVAEADESGWKFAHRIAGELPVLGFGGEIQIHDLGGHPDAIRGADIRWLWNRVRGDRTSFMEALR